MQEATDIERRERLVSLTPRERDVFELLVKCLGERDMCEQLALSKSRLYDHIAAVYEKLGLSDVPRGRARTFALEPYRNQRTADSVDDVADIGTRASV